MYLIEFSVNEGAFHVEPMAERMHQNIELARKGIAKDYTAVGFAITREQADIIIKQIRLKIMMEIELHEN